MIAEVAIPPAVGGLADLLIPVTAFVLLLFLLGTRLGYDYTLGALTRKLASAFRWKIPLIGKGLPGLGSAANGLDAIDHFVQKSLASGIQALESVFGKWLHANAILVRYAFDSVAAFAGDVHRAVDSIVHGTIPKAIGHGTHAVKVDLGELRVALQSQAATLEHDLRKTARALEHEIELDFGKAWRGIDHIRGSLSGAIAHALAVAETDIAALNRYARRTLTRRLSLLEKLVGAGVIGAAGLWIVSRTFPWLRCSNVNRLGRAVCRFPTHLLEALLADALEAAVVLNICEAVKAFTKIADAFEPELAAVVGVTGAALRCSSGDAPADLAARGAALPSSQAPAELPSV